MKLNTIFLSICIMLFASCLKKEYEGPPDTSGNDPKLTVTNTIAQLLQKPQGIMLSDDIVISGIVVMDDKSGNYSRKIVLQDSSAGIEILLNQSNLYNDFPIGRKLYIKCKGLYLTTFGGNPQLGYKPDNTGAASEIPELLINDFVVRASYPNPITADTLTIAQLYAANPSKYLNKLIVLKDVEFSDSCSAIPYAEQAILSSATSLTIRDCNGKEISLRTSAYARFQPYFTPNGNGTLTGIFTTYNNIPQIYIRDTNDVRFNNVRCDGSGTGGWKAIFYQDFSSLNNSAPVALGGWVNFSETGDKQFIKGTFQTDVFAKITAYGGTVPPIVKTWLVTPPIDLSNTINPKLVFKTIDGFDNGATLKVYVSTSYQGSDNPSITNWTMLEAPVSNGHQSSFATTWTVANVHLDYNVPVRIAFVYEAGGNKTTTFELGYIKVTSE